MRYAALAAAAFFLAWLFWGATLYVRVLAGSAPARLKIRLCLGVIPLFTFRWKPADVRLADAQLGGANPGAGAAAPETDGGEPAGKAEKPSASKQKKQSKRHVLAKKMLPAALRSALWLYRRSRVEDMGAEIDIGLADDAALTALLCAGAYSIAGGLAVAQENAGALRSVKITPHFNADVFCVSFSCIISLRLRHIILESFKLIKEAIKWGRTLSKT